MFLSRKLRELPFVKLKEFLVGGKYLSRKLNSTLRASQDSYVVPIRAPFLPDRSGLVPLNAIPQLTEITSFHLRDKPVGKMFTDMEKLGLVTVVKSQEIKIFPDFYNHWKTNDKLLIYCLPHDVGKTSFNIQFDIYDETNTVLLCRNMRTLVVCNIHLKPHPLPKDVLDILLSSVLSKERYFIPQPFTAKPAHPFEVSTIVRPSDLDVLYHVNQSNYLMFMLDAAVSAANNRVYDSLTQDIGFAQIDHIVLNYSRELRLYDNVKIETWEEDEHPMKLCFEMSSNSKVAFQGSVLLKEPLLKLSDSVRQRLPRAKEFDNA